MASAKQFPPLPDLSLEMTETINSVMEFVVEKKNICTEY